MVGWHAAPLLVQDRLLQTLARAAVLSADLAIINIITWTGYPWALWPIGGPIEIKRSHEYASLILRAEITGDLININGNVANHGYIESLPRGCCVEVPCLVDHNGIQPTSIGNLPPHLAAIMRTNINVQMLAVEVLVTGRREHVYHEAMLDSHTSAELDLDQIRNLVDDLIEAHAGWLPELT